MKIMNKIIFIFIVGIVLSTIINAEGFLTYIVKQGDNLSIIAKSFGVSVDELISINNVKNPNLIVVNQELKIPKKIQTYKVKKGDSLWKIAEKFATKISRLIEMNNLENPNKIFIGQNLIIPENNNNNRYKLASRSQKTTNFIWPVQGTISSEYGWRKHPIKGERLFHTGIDIAVPYGTPVYAAETGIVQFSGWSEGYGNLVIIRHRDNRLTYYGHNLELLVHKGQTVKQGKVIALSGNSGVSTGPHLHFEIRINGRHTNPLKYLNRKYMNNNFRV